MKQVYDYPEEQSCVSESVGEEDRDLLIDRQRLEREKNAASGKSRPSLNFNRNRSFSVQYNVCWDPFYWMLFQLYSHNTGKCSL